MQEREPHIRAFGDPVLRRPAEPVGEVDEEIRAICARMVETMIRSEGAGLAAPQIGVSKRIIVLDVEGEFHVLINPELVSTEGDWVEFTEGCLSVPGTSAPVARRSRATVSGVKLDGERVEITGEGLLARAIQHEMDHLDGHLYLDHLSPARRRSALKEHRRSQRREED
ncbi:MAG: peptide deformylase [Candidatus Bipolaricaulota bacterium]